MIKKRLDFLYNKEDSDYAYKEIVKLIKKQKKAKRKKQFSEKDVILITFADGIKEKNNTLKTFYKFSKYLKNINTIHFLPFFPYSSDRGFSVIDYRRINKDFGTWSDVNKIGKKFNLMFDFVLNHVSAKSDYFKDYLKGKNNFFIEVDPKIDLSKVFRPRSTPLLTKFKDKYVWTTFSKDQVDLNFKDPKVLVECIDILLFFIRISCFCN